MPSPYDVAVIGAGPGGYVAAIRAGQFGLRAVLVERDTLGGVCLNVGCIPSKALIHAAKLKSHIDHASDVGIEVGGAKVDVAKLQKWKQGVVDRLTGGIAALCKANKVEVLKGEARLASPTSITIAAGATTSEVHARHVILATGSRPIEIPGFKYDGKKVISSTEALSLPRVPKDLLVIGGGAIGLELGMVYQAFGAKLTVVEILDQLLPGTDPELARVLERQLKRRGADVHTRAKATSFDGKAVTVEMGDGEKLQVPADVVLVAVGRRPNSDGLGLDKAGVKADAKGFVPVDAQCRTNVANVFAIGDLTGPPMLAHKATHEALVAAETIAGKKAARDFVTVPGVVYTDPEIATAGLTEAEAKAKGHDILVGRFPFAASGRALTTNESEGFVKVVADRRTDLVLGVHIVGPAASDLISEAALALEMGATLTDLARTVHPHPTLPEAIMEASEHAHGRAIHTRNG